MNLDQTPLKPRAHQLEAIAAVVGELAGGGRAQMVAACGSGKTLIGRWVDERLQARRTVVVVPSLILLAQTLREWRDAWGSPFEAFVCCSDPTTPEGIAERATAAGFDLDVPFWSEQRAQVSTSAVDVNRWLRDAPADRPVVVFSTYHSLKVVAAAARHTQTVFDLGVFDEAHHLAGSVRADWMPALDDRLMPCRRRLYMTATPVHVDGTNEAGLQSMNDARTFGPVVYRLSVAAAIEQGLLVDYDVLVVDVTAGDGDGDAPPGTVDPLAAVVAAAGEGAGRLISFHSRVAGARAFARDADTMTLPDGRTVHARVISAATSAGTRTAALAELATDRPGVVQLVTNARCLGEGVDVPAVDGVVFADPRSSVVDVVQAVGRALRTAPGKTRGLVVVPITLEHDVDDDTAIAAGPYAGLWKVLRAMRSVDERLAEQLDGTVRTAARQPTRNVAHTLPMLKFCLPDGVDTAAITARLVEATGAGWHRFLGMVEAFVDAHGSVLQMPTNYLDPATGAALGQWATRQRQAYRRGALPADRVQLLGRIRGWSWNVPQASWQWLAAELTEIATTHGTLDLDQPDLADRVLTSARSGRRGGRAPSVGRWCAAQRIAYRAGELDDVQVRTLEAVPGWQWMPCGDTDAAMVDLLGEYVAWKHDANPPRNLVEDDLPLGRWVDELRRRKVTGRLPRPLQDEVDHVTPARSTPGALRWETSTTHWRLALTALRQFTAREGTCRPREGHVEALVDFEVNLHTWCRQQRHAHRYGQLDPARGATLETVPGWLWEVPLREGRRLVLEGDDVVHGRRATYVRGCKCEPCSDANRAAQTERDQRAAAGLPTTDLVDAAAAGGHLRILAGQGAGQKELARASGLNVKTVVEVMSGQVRRIRPETDEQLRAVTMADVAAAKAPGARVPAGPTWVLLDELVELGWPKTWLARELGRGSSLQLSRLEVTAQAAADVVVLHERVGGRRRPPTRQRGYALPTLTDLNTTTQHDGACSDRAS